MICTAATVFGLGRIPKSSDCLALIFSGADLRPRGGLFAEKERQAKSYVLIEQLGVSR